MKTINKFSMGTILIAVSFNVLAESTIDTQKIFKGVNDEVSQKSKANITAFANESILEGVTDDETIETNTVSAELEDLVNKTKQLTMDLQSEKSKSSNLESKLLKQNEVLDKLKVKKEEVKKKLQASSVEISKLIKEIKNKDSNIEGQNKKLKTLLDDQAKRQLENESLIKNLREAEKKLAIAIKKHEKEIKSSREFANKNFVNGLNIQNELDILREHGQELFLYTLNLEKKNRDLNKMILDMLSMYDVKTKKQEETIFQLKLSVNRYEERLKEKEEENKSLKKENSTLQEELAQIKCINKRKDHNLEAEIKSKAIFADVNKVIAKQEETEETKSTEVDKLNEKIEKLEKELAEANDDGAETETEKGKKKDKNKFWGNDMFKTFALFSQMMRFMPQGQQQVRVVREVAQTTNQSSFANNYFQSLLIKQMLDNSRGFNLYDPYSKAGRTDFQGYSLLPGVNLIKKADRLGGAFAF